MFGNLKKKIDEDYFKTEVTKIDNNDVSIAMDSQDKVDDKINNSGLLQKYSELAKLMYGMLKDYRKGVYNKVPWFTIATVAFSFLYILNPLDIIPDFIPGLGYIDDMAIFTFGLRFIESDLHNYLDWKIEEEA
ncbi:YkvA family protein [uncultured Christiangramia sp.]|uniref:YkvA family protein n=1 Tax=uncultured Christiangramia sp. TaxID=503836 RepID=UPI0025EC1976|nr:YkvA family protein [uncultured Christiangramia sp.]|tara:strand:+ start:1421 stop:1819 length:399 start_codon:yes stop_codon:yes gene_type:complete